MADIPQVTDTQQIVEALYKGIERTQKQKFRLTRLGASAIGGECNRAIWYDWRGFDTEEFGGRMMRLFKTGHLQEDRIVDDLKHAGYHVWEKDEQTGEQWTYTAEEGHTVVKLDGVIKGIPGAEKSAHVLEIKTHNKKSFDDVQKKGVQVSKPAHYDQMHCGMMDSGIHRALYVALCKDDERYHVERLVFDPEYAKKLSAKRYAIVHATIPPVRLCRDADDFNAKWCKMKDVCFNGKAPKRTCRSCQHCEVGLAGSWNCGLLSHVLTPDDQLKACEHYRAYES